ncbi:MAG: LpqB family beta-propeller domain-containing protein [Gemmatimonadales bacterium]
MRCRAPVLTCVLVALLDACGGESGGSTEPIEGRLEIIASTTGSDLDPDGYVLSVDDGAPQPLPTNGADTVASLSPGIHRVTLTGVAPNCLLGGANPRSVDIPAASTTSLRLDVACSTPLAAISVGAATTGDDVDPDGYDVVIDRGTPQPLPINGSVRISGLTPGEHEVALSDVAENCVIAGSNPRTVAAPSGSTANAAFTVTCSPLPLAAPGYDVAFTASDGDGEVYLLSADGTTLTNLTNDPSGDEGPAWSPDGRSIAFTSHRTGRWQVYVMNADGSGQTQLTSGSFATSPDWSPDGTKIAFSGVDGGGHEQIYVMNPDGSAITQLTTTTTGTAPAWSPDGTRVAFMSAISFETDIFVMNADGSDVTRLTTSSGIDANPAWSPDGTKIAFNSDRSSSSAVEARQIHVMNADGTDVTQLTFGTDFAGGAAWSPDGSKIAFSTGTRIYMMNPDGTEQVPLTASLDMAGGLAWRP